MSNRKAEFMRKILEQPEEDTARLVYADYLDEEGEDKRARLIRIQCAIHELNRRDTKNVFVSDLDDLKKWREEEKQLLSTGRVFDWLHFTQCMPGMPAVNYINAGICQFFYEKASQSALYATWRRGFVEELTCTAEDWVKHSDSIWPNEDEPRYETAHPLKKVHFRRWMGLMDLQYKLAGCKPQITIMLDRINRAGIQVERTLKVGETTSQMINRVFGKVYPGLEFEIVS